MSKHMIEDLLYLYEQDPAQALIDYEDNTNRHEYILDVQANRIKSKLMDKVQQIYSKSPEELLIEKEEKEKILHFILWVKHIICEEDRDSWDIWERLVVYKENAEQIGVDYDKTRKEVYKIRNNVYGKIKKYIPYYNEQFGDLKEYLKS